MCRHRVPVTAGYQMNYPRLMLAAPHSGAGKTTLTMGLIAALKKRGLSVQPFKAGPDYIDPSYHSLAAGRVCRNLDSWMLSGPAVLELFERQARGADISIIEGVMGLYDGYQAGEEGSSAHLAKILDCPVILIVDARSMSRSAAAVVLGYKEFDRDVDVAGVILNNIGSPSHYGIIKNAVEKNTGLPVFGFLAREKELCLPERHLGLIPADEKRPLPAFLKRIGDGIEKTIDIHALISVSKNKKKTAVTKSDSRLFLVKNGIFSKKPAKERVAVAVAHDAAFNFYYEDNLDILRHNGARLIEFSPLKDKSLPAGVDGVYIGGGFPELFAARLARNSGLKHDIIRRAREGMPVYAECGGLMYLAKAIVDFKGGEFSMAGIFDFSVRMNDTPAAVGYVHVDVVKNNILADAGMTARAHVFHWSSVSGLPRGADCAFRVRKEGRESVTDGFMKWRCLAGYSHFHFGAHPEFAENFIRGCAGYAHEKNQQVK